MYCELQAMRRRPPKHFAQNLLGRLCISQSFGSAHAHSRRFSINQRLLRTDPPELESGLGLDNLAVHLKERIGQKIDRSTFRFWIDNQVAPLR